MKNWKLTNWCSVAAHMIRYGPDREAVFLELKQHLDERSDSFLAKGMTEKEATEKTLEVMGNPYELAITLGKIHRPYWGFAYSIFRVLAIILVVSALVFTAANMIFSLTGKTYTQPKYDDYSPSYTDTETEYMTRIGFWEQSDSDSFGGYTYQLEKAALWDRKVNGHDTLRAQIRITNYLPWAAKPEIAERLEAVDNLGNYYVNVWFNHSNQQHSLFGGYEYHTEPFVWLLDIDVNSPDFSGVEWIEIRSMNNHDFALRIDLTGGGAQ